MSARGNVDGADRGESYERELLMEVDGDEDAPELNEEELLAGGEEEEEDGVQPRGDSVEESAEDEELRENGEEDDEIVDQSSECSETAPQLDQEGHGEEGMKDESEEPDEDDVHTSEENNYDGDEEEDAAEQKYTPEETRSRRSTRSTRVSTSAGLDEEEEEEEGGGGGEDDEEEEEEGDTLKRGADGHPTLLAQSGEGIIHVGSEYQATIMETEGGSKKSAREEEDRDTALWIPPPGGLNEDGLVEFCEEAMGIYMLSFDRALYILQNCGYDFKKALETIAVRKTVKEEWSDDDNLLFRQAYALYGKNFARIRQTMPHRSMSSIIHHYYSTKKQQDYKSLQDSKIDSIGFHIEDSGKERQYLADGGKCDNCFEMVNKLFLIDESKQCNTCLLYFKLMLKPRPVPREELPEQKSRRRKLQLNNEYNDIVEDFMELAEQRPEPDGEPPAKRGGVGETHLRVCVFQSRKTKVHEKMRQIENDIMRCRTRIVRIDQEVKNQKRQLQDKAVFDKLRSQVEKAEAEKGRVRMQYTWTDQEKVIAFHCFVRYGRDFEAVAEVVGTKTPDMVKSLYQELKDDIDKIIDDAEEEDAMAAATMDRDAVLGREKPVVEVVDLD